MNAIAILCKTPNKEFLDFYASLKNNNYDVYIFIDDNNYQILNSQGLNFIQIDTADSIQNGFHLFSGLITDCGAWDKAIYYFSTFNTAYNFVWFIEDDVFIPNKDIIRLIDEKYLEEDVLCQDHTRNLDGDEGMQGWMWWVHITKEVMPPPWGKSMMCASRLSSKLLKTVKNFISDNKNANKFIEYFFVTLASQNNLRVKPIPELKKIVYSHPWNSDDLSHTELIHPIKDLSLHTGYRKLLAEKY